ncbi:MAG: glycine zipper 2TM domain-containing protein [Paraglaciecola sp.]|uniref:glycine zipper 2TM domain-containing protein n=1 Tax=Paraglaciecola sp. TaxID=1920173 RepID=UPI0032995B74
MKTLLTSTLLLLALSPLAQAKNHHTVKVVKTVPTHKYQVVKQPKYVQAKTIKVSHKKPNTGVIIGGVVGGVVGGLIGHNTSTHQNKVVGTIAGAIIGSALGHQIDKVTDSHHTKVYKKVTHNKRHR